MRLDGFSIARTETTVAQCRRHADATGRINCAERQGSGQVYEASWTTQPGWTWRRPFGESPALDDEPAVHISFDEAQVPANEPSLPASFGSRTDSTVCPRTSQMRVWHSC